MKNRLPTFLALLVVVLTFFSFLMFRGGKAAHKLHYRGTLHFIDGNYQRAAGLFRRAYEMDPENYNFALSFGLGLGRTGKTIEGLHVLQDATLSERDPAYQQKIVLKTFFEGMVHAYAGHYHKAIPLYKKSIELQERLDEPRVLSVMYNALGYAILLNQGKGAHGRDDLPPHYHVHKRDMLRAMDNFEKALTNDAANETARYNYTVLCDSLGLTPKPFTQTPTGLTALKEGNTYRDLPANIAEAMAFQEFDEVVFLLDISGSMVQEKVVCQGETRFDVMKETMRLILDEIDDRIQVGIGTIGGDCGTDPRLWYRSDALTRKELDRHLGFLVPDGTTPLLDILKQSPALFTDATDHKKVIFLVSDGANVCNAQGVDICAWASELPQQNITINILTFLETNFGNANAFAEYGCLADNTNGRILYIDNYNCRMERYEFDLLETCQFRIPALQHVDCWGPAVKDLWAIFEE